MSQANNRSGYSDWQHSPEARQLTTFIQSNKALHWLICDEPHLWQALIQDWSQAARPFAAIASLHASSYALLHEKQLSPLQQTSRPSQPTPVLIILDSQLLTLKVIKNILQEHNKHPHLKLILCGNSSLLRIIDELGFSDDHITAVTAHDVRVTHQVLQRLLDNARTQYPNLPLRPSISMLTDIHTYAKGQVSLMETAFTRWLQKEQAASIQNNVRNSQARRGISSLWRSRRFATQGVSLALMVGLSITGWQQVSHRKVHTLTQPSVHHVNVNSQAIRNAPMQTVGYTVTVATSYSKKRLISYEKKHHIPANQAHIRRIAGKKHQYELDIGDYPSRAAANTASRQYVQTQAHYAPHNRTHRARRAL